MRTIFQGRSDPWEVEGISRSEVFGSSKQELIFCSFRLHVHMPFDDFVNIFTFFDGNEKYPSFENKH